jgi:hypothetical protein
MHTAHSSVVDGGYTSRMSRQTSSQAHFEPQLVVVDQQIAEFRFVLHAVKTSGYVCTRSLSNA